MNHELKSRKGVSEANESWGRTNIVCWSLRHIIKKKIALKCKDNHILKTKEKILRTLGFPAIGFGRLGSIFISTSTMLLQSYCW